MFKEFHTAYYTRHDGHGRAHLLGMEGGVLKRKTLCGRDAAWMREGRNEEPACVICELAARKIDGEKRPSAPIERWLEAEPDHYW